MTTPTRPSALDAIHPTKAQNRMWLFAQEYIVDLNATRAAVRAGYAERHAAAIASKLLRKVNVEYWIDEAQELKARSRNITIDRVLEEYRRVAFAQTTDMVTLKGGYVQISDTDSLTTEQKSAISQIRQPHADEVLLGGKDVENRTWRLPSGMKGQRIYVHAGLKPRPGYRGSKDRLGAILG